MNVCVSAWYNKKKCEEIKPSKYDEVCLSPHYHEKKKKKKTKPSKHNEVCLSAHYLKENKKVVSPS